MTDDFIKSLGLIGYTARIRRLNDSLMAMGKAVYSNLHLDIEPNWHLILLLLKKEKELSATEIAQHLSFTHTAIIKMAKKMLQKEYLVAYRSKTDNRKQMYALSAKAIKELPHIEANINLIAVVHKQYVRSEFISELDHIESALKQKDTIVRVNELLRKNICINDELSLEAVVIEHHQKLEQLISKIYTPAYSHLWTDSGKEYLEAIYSKENLEKELQDASSQYYFVNFKGQSIGIFRFIKAYNKGIGSASIKLDRIYLNNATQGKGIGTQLIKWLEKEYTSHKIWLEVMDTQHLAIKFYEKLGYQIVDKTQLTFSKIIPRYKGMFLMSK